MEPRRRQIEAGVPQSAISTTSETSMLSVISSKPKGSHKKKGKSKPLYFWSSDNVSKWLRKHCADHYNNYKEAFAEHDISGRSLVRLNDMKLQRMGIDDGMHRAEILRHIMQLQLLTESREFKNLDQKKDQKKDQRSFPS